MYFDQLQFLLKISDKDVTESSICDNADSQQSEEEKPSVSSQAINPRRGPSSPCARKRSRTTEIGDTDKPILKNSEATCQPPPPPQIDEDTAFFASVTPAVKNFTEDEKIEFRMGVLTLIKQIKENR